MTIETKKIFNATTFEKAVKLIREAKFTIAEICKELHTSVPTLVRNMNCYFNIPEDESETDWRKIYKVKYSINKQKKKRTRIVWECVMCGGESKTEVDQCKRCGSYCINKRELREELTSTELRSANMTGHRL